MKLTISMKGYAIALLVLFAPYLHAEDKMTPIDKAYAAAVVNQAKAGDFYNLFMRSDIFIPTFDTPQHEGSRRAGEQESFNPVIIENNGQKTLIMFDTLERLKGYAKREIGYIAMPGHAILESMPEGIHWALNHTTKHYKEFSPEEVAHLKKMAEASQPKPTIVKKGTQIMIGAPAKVPEGLINVLRETLKQNDEVRTARLGQVYIQSQGEVPHMALVVTTGGISGNVKQAMMKDLSVASEGKLSEGEHIDILIDEPGQFSDGIISEVEPFYTKK